MRQILIDKGNKAHATIDDIRQQHKKLRVKLRCETCNDESLILLQVLPLTVHDCMKKGGANKKVLTTAAVRIGNIGRIY